MGSDSRQRPRIVDGESPMKAFCVPWYNLHTVSAHLPEAQKAQNEQATMRQILKAPLT